MTKNNSPLQYWKKINWDKLDWESCGLSDDFRIRQKEEFKKQLWNFFYHTYNELIAPDVAEMMDNNSELIRENVRLRDENAKLKDKYSLLEKKYRNNQAMCFKSDCRCIELERELLKLKSDVKQLVNKINSYFYIRV